MSEAQHPSMAPGVKVCLACGAMDCSQPSTDCAHPRVAVFRDLPPAVSNTIVRLQAARRCIGEALSTIDDAANIEAAVGRADIFAIKESASGVLVFPKQRRAAPAREPRPTVPASEVKSGPMLTLRNPDPVPRRKASR